MAEDRNKWRAVVHTVLNLRIPYNKGMSRQLTDKTKLIIIIIIIIIIIMSVRFKDTCLGALEIWDR